MRKKLVKKLSDVRKKPRRNNESPDIYRGFVIDMYPFLFGLLANISQNTAVDIQDMTIDGI